MLNDAEENDKNDSGNYCGQEASQNRLTGTPSKEHLGGAGRNQKSQNGGACNQRAGDTAGVTPFAQLGSHNRANAAESGARTATDSAENGTGYDGNGAETATEATNKLLNKADKSVAQFSSADNRTGYNKQRDAQQHRVNQLAVAIRHQEGGRITQRHHQKNGSCCKAEGNRDTHNQKYQKQYYT